MNMRKKLSIILAMILLFIALCSTAEAMITLPFGYYTHNGFKIIYTTKAVCIGVNTLMTRDGNIWEYEDNNFTIGGKYRITFSDNGRMIRRMIRYYPSKSVIEMFKYIVHAIYFYIKK